jgi:hypothetical protein
MKQGGGGYLIFGIPILALEHDPLKLFSQAADFAFALRVPDALQAQV